MQKDINSFIEYCGISGGASTLKKIKIKITTIDKFFNRKLDNLELKDLHRFLSYLNKLDFANSHVLLKV